jgi:hypothetical protein
MERLAFILLGERVAERDGVCLALNQPQIVTSVLGTGDLTALPVCFVNRGLQNRAGLIPFHIF